MRTGRWRTSGSARRWPPRPARRQQLLAPLDMEALSSRRTLREAIDLLNQGRPIAA
jgi:hypothetical protein